MVPKMLRNSNNKESKTKCDGERGNGLDAFFPERTNQRLGTMERRIGFKFAGCRPLLRQQQSVQGRRIGGVEAVGGGVEGTGSRRGNHVIVASRKLLRPLTNVRSCLSRVYDLSSIHF